MLQMNINKVHKPGDRKTEMNMNYLKKSSLRFILNVKFCYYFYNISIVKCECKSSKQYNLWSIIFTRKFCTLVCYCETETRSFSFTVYKTRIQWPPTQPTLHSVGILEHCISLWNILETVLWKREFEMHIKTSICYDIK